MNWANILILLSPIITQAVVILRDDGGGGGKKVKELLGKVDTYARKNSNSSSSKPLEKKKPTIRGKKAKVKLSSETSVEQLRQEIKKKGIDTEGMEDGELMGKLDVSQVGEEELGWLPIEFYQQCTAKQVLSIIERHKYDWLSHLSRRKIKTLFSHQGSTILLNLDQAEGLESAYWAYFDLTEALSRFGSKLSKKHIYHLFHLHTFDPSSHFAKSVAESIHGCLRTGQYQFIMSNFDAMREMDPAPQAILDRVDTFSTAYRQSPERFCRPSPTTLSLEELFNGNESPVGEDSGKKDDSSHAEDSFYNVKERIQSAPKPIPNRAPMYSSPHHKTFSYPNDASVANNRKSNYYQFAHSSYSSHDDSDSSSLGADDSYDSDSDDDDDADSVDEADSSERSARLIPKIVAEGKKAARNKPKGKIEEKKRKDSVSLPSQSYRQKVAEAKKPTSSSKDKTPKVKKSPALALKQEKAEKVERVDKPAKTERADKSDKADKVDKSEKKTGRKLSPTTSDLIESMHNLFISSPLALKVEKRTLSASETESA